MFDRLLDEENQLSGSQLLPVDECRRHPANTLPKDTILGVLCLAHMHEERPPTHQLLNWSGHG